MTMISNERLDGLLAYLDGLTKLKHEGDYMCVKEMTECIGWIREEFTKGPSSVTTEQLADDLLSRDGVHGQRSAIGPVKWELSDGSKATFIAFEEDDSE